MLPRPDVLPLSEDDLKNWRSQIAKAREVRQQEARRAEANLKAYAPTVDTNPDDYDHHINTNRDFTLVERKKADLFYQSPEIAAKASPLFEGHEDLLDTHVAILNEKLGLDGVNAKAMVHQVLFDVLCPWGTGFTIMGYESTTVPTPVTKPTLHPMTGQPMMGPDGKPLEEPVLHPVTQEPLMAPVPVHEECFWEWFSPWRMLKPADFRSSEWDKAPWLGMEVEIPIRTAKRKGWVPDDYEGAPAGKELHYDDGTNQSGDNVARGVIVFYKSALYRDDIVHPQHLTYLVLMEGTDSKGELSQPAEHKDCPYQTLDPHGALTADSLIGFPIHPCTLRTLTDSSIVPSDCTISRPLINELNLGREQMVSQREANLLQFYYDAGTMPADVLNKRTRGPLGGMIGLPSEVFTGSGPEGPFRPFVHGAFPRENFEFNNILDNDLARTHALDSNQQGVVDQGGTTATEAQIQQSNVNARLGLERGNVLDWYVRGVTKFSTLLQRYETVQSLAKIVGQQAAESVFSWYKTVPSSLAFTAEPDSALRSDTAADRKQATDLYSFLANDPNVDRVELLKSVLRKHHLNPSKIVVQPPPKGPEPARPSFAFGGADLNPLAPQFAIVMEVLRLSGVQISPQAVQEAQAGAQNALLAQQVQTTQDAQQGAAGPQTEHGGKVAQVESLSKHAAALTGGMQGSGQPAPMGAGGGVM